MLKRLARLFMQTLMVAALILSGSGVQANPGTPMERVQLQEQGMDTGCTMDVAAEKKGTVPGDGAMTDCQMEADSCHANCANSQSVNSDMPAVHPGATYSLSSPAVLAAIAAQYPIDHPPKPASSL